MAMLGTVNGSQDVWSSCTSKDLNMSIFSPSGLTTHDGLIGTQGAVIDDTGPTIPEIPARLFFSEVLPRPTVLDHVPAILAALVSGTKPHYNLEKRRWLEFPQDPAKAKLKEGPVFRRLEKIHHAIVQTVGRHCPAERLVTTFTNSPEYIPEGNWRQSTSKPDAFFALRDRRAGGVPHWMDIVATGEYQRHDLNKRNRDDDSKKVLWNMHETMRNDPCRRFTFGFTIDNREMRIWYASRADILVSTSFDFMNAPLLLIEFFLRFSFAGAHALGWDPTMTCVWRGPDKPPHYIITVRSEETGEEADFRATDMLSDRGADTLRGKGTRVFKVRQLKDGEEVGDELVLKDCWVDADHVSEGRIMADIKRDAAGTPQEAALESGLLTVAMHGGVYVHGELDRTISKDTRKELFDWDSVYLVHRSDTNVDGFKGFATGRGLKERAEQGSHPSRICYADRGSLGSTMYCPKKHYRIVFKETCKPLFLEDGLSRILFILGQTCKILKALHQIGWVHRDISLGNILTDGETVKLADLEYAKRTGKATDGCRETRTGTPDFMSIEVFNMAYTFVPFKSRVGPTPTYGNYKWDIVYAPKEALRPEPVQQPPRSPWSYNPLNDLESVFWLIAYYILSRDIYLPDALSWPPPLEQESDTARAARIEAQYEFAERLFIRRDPLTRTATLTSPILLHNQLIQAPLHPALLTVGKCLIQARDELQDAYAEAEETLPIPPNKAAILAGDLYERFGYILHHMRQNLQDNHVSNIRCRPLSAEYRLILECKAAKDEEKKKARYELEERFESEQQDEVVRLAQASRVVPKNAAPEGKHSTPDIPLAQRLRRSQRIASRVVDVTHVDEGRPEEEDKPGNENYASHRTRKTSTRFGLGKRKRGDDDPRAIDAMSSGS